MLAGLVPKSCGLGGRHGCNLDLGREDGAGKVRAEACQHANGPPQPVGCEARVQGRTAGSNVAPEMIERYVPNGDKLRRHDLRSTRKNPGPTGSC